MAKRYVLLKLHMHGQQKMVMVSAMYLSVEMKKSVDILQRLKDNLLS